MNSWHFYKDYEDIKISGKDRVVQSHTKKIPPLFQAGYFFKYLFSKFSAYFTLLVFFMFEYAAIL